jgi:hypothetical protein
MWNSASPNYGISKRAEWTSIEAGVPDSVMDPEDRGWYIPLRDLDSEKATYEPEYVTTRPEMINGKLYVATFQEIKYEKSGAACDTGQKNGLARLYTVGMDTGKAALWNSGKYLTFKGIKITGFTRSEKGKRETLLVHYTLLNTTDAAASIRDEDNGVTSKENITESGLPNTLEITELGSSGTTINVTSNDQVVNYWRFIE